MKENYPDPQPGDPALISADEYKARNREIERRENLSVVFPVMLSEGKSGKTLSFNSEVEIHARLSGSANPYSFQEVQLIANVWTDVAGGYSGTSNMYDINSITGLNNKIVKAWPGYPGDWRCQYVARTGGGTPPTCQHTIIHVIDHNGNTEIAGATVSITVLRPGIIPPQAPVNSGTTTGTGYDAGILGAVNYYTAHITYNGCSFLVSFYGCQSFNVYYCKATLHVATDGDLRDTSIFGQSIGGLNGHGISGVISGTDITFCEMTTNPKTAFPLSVFVYVVKTGTKGNCGGITLHCGDDATLSLPTYDYTGSYWDGGCDSGCELYGAGPNYRGLLPKTLYATLEQTNFLGQCDYLGSLAGQTLTMNGVYIPPLSPGNSTIIPIIYWDSGCLPNPGIKCDPCNVYATQTWKSAKLIVTANCGATLYLYGRSDCIEDRHPVPPQCNDFTGVINYATGSCCITTAPVNGTIYPQLDFPVAVHLSE